MRERLPSGAGAPGRASSISWGGKVDTAAVVQLGPSACSRHRPPSGRRSRWRAAPPACMSVPAGCWSEAGRADTSLQPSVCSAQRRDGILQQQPLFSLSLEGPSQGQHYFSAERCGGALSTLVSLPRPSRAWGRQGTDLASAARPASRRPRPDVRATGTLSAPNTTLTCEITSFSFHALPLRLIRALRECATHERIVRVHQPFLMSCALDYVIIHEHDAHVR